MCESEAERKEDREKCPVTNCLIKVVKTCMDAEKRFFFPKRRFETEENLLKDSNDESNHL